MRDVIETEWPDLAAKFAAAQRMRTGVLPGRQWVRYLRRHAPTVPRRVAQRRHISRCASVPFSHSAEDEMRKPTWSTTRWRLPRSVREENYSKVFAKQEFKETFDTKFADGLEKRHDVLEGRKFKIVAIQIPIFILLLLSVLDLDFPITILGVTPHSSKNIRELLISVYATIGLYMTNLDIETNELKEVLRAYIQQRFRTDPTAELILRKRYGLGTRGVHTPSDDLFIGRLQLIFGTLGAFATILVVAVLFIFAVVLEVYVLIDIYNSPSFSPLVSKMTIVYVVACNIAAIVYWLFNHSLQPFQSFADFERLGKLQVSNPEEYDRIIRDIVAEHYKKGLFRRLLTRPKMKRIT